MHFTDFSMYNYHNLPIMRIEEDCSAKAIHNMTDLKFENK